MPGREFILGEIGSVIKKLGKYGIAEKLGEGSMGDVYKARDTILGRNVAIKLMAADIQRNPELKLRFYREAKAAANLHHPNIVTIYDLGEDGNTAYIVMELLQGRNLKDIIRDRLEISLEQKLSIMAQVADGLSCAHQSGFIHRDVKPGNIFFTNAGIAKILDFGIAHMPSSDLTRAGQRLGPPVYMSPEQLRGEKCDERSDMFSAGIVLYELLTYIHPFRDKDFAKAMDNILFQDQFNFNEQFPEAPQGLWPILRTCLAKNPSDRYPSMEELSKACRRLMDELKTTSRQLLKELKAALAGLAKASERSDVPENLVRLLREAQNLLDREEKADYLSLLRLKSALAKDPLLLRIARDAAQKTDPATTEDTAAKPPEASAAPTPAQALDVQGEEGAVAQSAGLAAENEVQGQQVLAEAQSLLAQDQLEPALDCLRRAIGLLGPKESLLQMLMDTRRKLEQRNRQRVKQLLEAAKEAIAAKQFSKANEALDEALELEPNHPDAVEVRRQVAAEIEADKRRQAEREEGEQEKSFGFRLLGEKKFRESLRVFRHASELLGEDSAVQVGIADSELGLRAEELQSRVQTGLAQAQQLLRSGILDQARQRVNEVLEMSPRNAEATDLLTQINRAQQEKNRVDAIASLLSQSENALDRKDFSLARSLADEARLQDSSSPRIQTLLQRIDQEKERQRRQEEMALLLRKAEEFLRQQDFANAEESAREALKVLPDHPAAIEFIKKTHQAREAKVRADRIATLIAHGYEELVKGNFQQAESCAREALNVETQNAAAAKLLAETEKRRIEHKNAKITELLSRSRDALGSGKFEEAANLANEIFTWDEKHKEARALVKEIKKAGRVEEREQKRQRKELKQPNAEILPAETEGKPIGLEETLVLKAFQPKKIPWIWICVIVGLIGVGIVAVAIYRSGREDVSRGLSVQLADAKSNLDKKMYDKAIEIARKALELSPGNPQAQGILVQAQEGKRKSDIEVYMVDAQVLKDKNQLEESRNTIEKILKIDSGYQPALTLRAEIDAQIDAEMEKLRTKEEQDKEIKKRLANARLLLGGCRLKEIRAEIDKLKGGQSDFKKGMETAQSLLAGCKLEAAKGELDRAARIGPDTQGIPPLREQIKAMTAEMASLREELDQQSNAEQSRKQGQIKELEARAEQLFRQGEYAECQNILSKLPQSTQTDGLRNQANAALAGLAAAQTAIRDKRLREARQALSRLKDINPSDPRIAGLEQQLKSVAASGRARLSIFRLIPSSTITLTLDDRQIGSNGDVKDLEIGTGTHRIVVTDKGSGTQNAKTYEFEDGTNMTLVYGSADLDLRDMNENDRVLYRNLKEGEKIRSFVVEHPHGGLVFIKGSCSGELLVNVYHVEYRGSEKGHQYKAPFSNLKLEVDGEKLKFKSTSKNESFPELKARSKANAKEIKELWGSLEKLWR